MMSNTFLKWFNYSYSANHQFIKIFEQENDIGGESVSIFSHILNAHLVWLSRIRKFDDVAVPGIWERQPISDFPALNANCYELTEKFLKGEDNELDLDAIISYRNSKGRSFRNSLQEIYFHILMHSMYHRGQVAMLFRKADIEPPVTDFIFQMRDERME